MKKNIQSLISQSLQKIGIEKEIHEIIIGTPDNEDHGDFSCNISMQLVKILKKNPREIAQQIIDAIPENTIISSVEIAGPGFLNFHIKKSVYTTALQNCVTQNQNIGKTERLKGKNFISEHTDPNLFKEVHIGHVMTNAIGESFYRLAIFAGANAKNVTFQGDVGMHIAKALWGIANIGEDLPMEKTPYEKQQFLGKCYVFGEKNFSVSTPLDNRKKTAKEEILAINKKVYSREDDKQNKLYDLGCAWSLEYLDTIYEVLGSKFDHYFLESSTFKDGQRIVEENTAQNDEEKEKKVFEKSDGAIIFKGSDIGLHDRVFINSEGLPTYEAKDIGLFYQKWEKYNPDYSLTITGGDQKEYFEIVREAAGLINSEWKEKTFHRAHGVLKMKSGKMSSRTGNIIRAQEWINDARENILKSIEERENNVIPENDKKSTAQKIAIAAIKYSILKVSAGKDIVYDEKVALEFTGNTGPYLQYSYVRALSIITKSKCNPEITLKDNSKNTSSFEKKIHQFESSLENSLTSLSSHHLANYLYDIASEFNSFYAHTKILDEKNPDYNYNLALVFVFKNIMKNGLWCLGIEVVEKM